MTLAGTVPREKRKVLKDKNGKTGLGSNVDHSILPRHPLGARLWSVCRRSSRSEGRPCLVDGPRSPEPKPRESGFHATQDRGVPKHRSRPVCLHPHATLQCRMFLGSSRGVITDLGDIIGALHRRLVSAGDRLRGPRSPPKLFTHKAFPLNK